MLGAGGLPLCTGRRRAGRTWLTTAIWPICPTDAQRPRGEADGRAFPDQEKSQIAVVVERPAAADTADLQWPTARPSASRARDELPLVDIWNRNSEIVGDKLTSRSTSKPARPRIVHGLERVHGHRQHAGCCSRCDEILSQAPRIAAEGFNMGVTGSAALGGDTLRSAAESMRNTE